MITENMTAVLDKIKQYNKIVIFRHKRPDGDAVGSTMGMARMLRLSFPDKEIYYVEGEQDIYPCIYIAE